MVRYDLCAIMVLFMMALFCSGVAQAETHFGNMNLYGFPLGIASPDSGAAAIPGQGFTYYNEGYELPDFSTTYGLETHEQSPILGGSLGYFGPGWNNVNLGVSFGIQNVDHDASNTAFSKDLYYESSLDQTFIGFPGLGVGSLGVGFPTITNEKSTVKYAESVKFEFSTESDSFQIGGFGYPLGLGLGYSSARVGTDPGLGVLSMPYYFGS